MMRCLVCGAEMYVTEVVEDGKRYGRSSASSLSPSYSPKLPKRATDVAERRNSIHVSGCETDSRID